MLGYTRVGSRGQHDVTNATRGTKGMGTQGRAGLGVLGTVLAALGAMTGSALLVGLGPTGPAAGATTETCGFATPGTGTYASTLCWLDLSGYTQSQATSSSGQAMAVSLPGGYTISFSLHVSGVLPVKPAAFPTFGDAYLGNDGHYTGVPGYPALYQTKSGSTTATLDGISVVDAHGRTMGGYAFVGADAESTDKGESITWTSNTPLSLLSTVGNACTSGTRLTGVGTTTVTCSATVSVHKTGTAILAAQTPSFFSQTMVGSGLQAVAFGVLVSTIQVTKDVVRSPYLSPDDAFSVSVTSASAPTAPLATADTATGDSATTGHLTVLTSNEGSDYVLAEQPEGETNPAFYTTTWSCTRNGVHDANLPSGDAGTSATVTVGIGDFVDCTITNSALPVSIALDKEAGVPTDANGDGLTDAGDTIDYTFTVTNTGALPLQEIAVSDPKVGAVTCPGSSLAPGGSETCTASPYTVTKEDELAGSVQNTATASGVVQPGYTPVTAQSSTSTPTEAPSPRIELVKVADASEGDDVAPGAGDTITYSYVVSNTGNVPLASVHVVDTKQPTVGTIDCPRTALDPGDSEECAASLPYAVTGADIVEGSVTDTATAYGTSPDGTVVESSSTVTVGTAAADPRVVVTKSGSVSPPSDQDAARAGDSVTYSYVVTNTGNVDLASVAVDDPTAGAVSCPTLTPPLAPGRSVTCTASTPYIVTQADVDAGSFTDTATASGVDTAGAPTPESGPSTVTIPTVAADPHLTLLKTATVTPVADQDAAKPGDTITYSYVVTNSGNVTMTTVTVDDSALGAVTCPDTTLAPGQSTTCTAEHDYVVSQSDVDAGGISDTAVAAGVPPGSPPPSPVPSNPSTATVRTEESPEVGIVKSATVSPSGDQDGARLGDTIAYSYVITNIGDVTLRSIAVEDPTLGPVTCPALPPEGLAPNGTVTCTADRKVVVDKADIAAGHVTDTATATGVDLSGVTSPPSEPSTATVPTVSTPVQPVPTTPPVTPKPPGATTPPVTPTTPTSPGVTTPPVTPTSPGVVTPTSPGVTTPTSPGVVTPPVTPTSPGVVTPPSPGVVTPPVTPTSPPGAISTIQTDLGRWTPSTGWPSRDAFLFALGGAVGLGILGFETVRRRSSRRRPRRRPRAAAAVRICLACASLLAAVAGGVGFAHRTPTPVHASVADPPSAAPRLGPQARSTPSTTVPVLTPPSTSPSLVIPSLGVDAPLVATGAVGAPGSASLTIPPDISEVGWWDGTLQVGSRRVVVRAPAPGAPGVAILAGHVDSAAAGPGALYRLDDLHVGQAIDVTDVEGKATSWRVITAPQLTLKSRLPASLFATTGPPLLALVTCGGPFDAATGHYDDNVIVWARLVT